MRAQSCLHSTEFFHPGLNPSCTIHTLLARVCWNQNILGHLVVLSIHSYVQQLGRSEGDYSGIFAPKNGFIQINAFYICDGFFFIKKSTDIKFTILMIDFLQYFYQKFLVFCIAQQSFFLQYMKITCKSTSNSEPIILCKFWKEKKWK